MVVETTLKKRQKIKSLVKALASPPKTIEVSLRSFRDGVAVELHGQFYFYFYPIILGEVKCPVLTKLEIVCLCVCVCKTWVIDVCYKV